MTFEKKEKEKWTKSGQKVNAGTRCDLLTSIGKEWKQRKEKYFK